MEIHDLHKKINLVLDEELRAYRSKGRSGGGFGSMNITTQSVPNNGWTNVGNIPKILFDESDPNIISSPNAVILLKLYSSLDTKDKNDLKIYLIAHLRKDSQYCSIAYFIFFVLYRISFGREALTQVKKALLGASEYGYSNFFACFSMIVTREFLHIDPELYSSAKLLFQDDPEYNFWLREKINLAELKQLEKDLEDVNPEINVDRDRIIEIWGKKFSTPEIPTSIKDIEEYFREGEIDSTKFATLIGRIRALLVEISKKVAIVKAKSLNDTSIKDSSEDHHYFQYLKDKNLVSVAEWNILRSLYDIASNEGAHALISNREYARLIKNISYEIILLLLSKYEI